MKFQNVLKQVIKICETAVGFSTKTMYRRTKRMNNNNNIYLLQLGCHPLTVVILHVNKHEIGYYVLNLIREGYMRSM